MEQNYIGLNMHRISRIKSHRPKTYACQITHVRALSANTFEVELQLPAGVTLNYQAGQYLQLALDLDNNAETTILSYSIANRCNAKQPHRLQIFIQNSCELANKALQHLIERNKKILKVNVILPKGFAFLQTELSLMHLLIAAGSGISKIKCLAEEILSQKPDAEVAIYWSNKGAEDFYLLDMFQTWQQQHNKLDFIPILESTDNHWRGRSGFIYEVIENDYNYLAGAQAYLCGSPQMVYGTIDRLKPRGLLEENCYSDVFEYAPRS